MSRLDKCYVIVAKLVSEHGDVYLPIFKRLHQEIQLQNDMKHLKEIASMVWTNTN